MSDSNDNDLSLFHACEKGRIRRVVKLLEDGADTEDKNQTYIFGLVTPLQVAVSHGELRVAELLINNGADMSVLYDNGESLLIRATRTGFGQPHLMADLLIRKGADVRYRHRHSTPQPYNFSRNTMPQSQNNWNALHVAAHCGASELVEVLLHHGADLLALTDVGETAEDLALKDYILKRDFGRFHRSEVDQYMHKHGFWRGGIQETRQYLGYVWGYDETVRLLRVAKRQLAFAMGHHPRLGEGSALMRFSPDLLRMVMNQLLIDRVPLDPRIE